ncbi:MAG: hypothetical protein JNL08_13195 [Planctomycetes bacterium]|nr:hypothetical protein [Planctomycetota bacterium]
MHAPTVPLSLLLSLPLAAAPQTPTPTPTVEWQRTLDDALAVQQATGLPLLIAVNMDGETFNDQFAGKVYRDPKFVETTRGYVCVVASPDRHNPADHDAAGNRIECPRFPGCTCGEHIAIEPELFRRWFQGTRNAPRHVGVDPAGKVLFDRFLDASMQTAIDAIGKHRGRPPADSAPPTALEALFARRDAASRRALERRYRNGDAAARKVLLAAAANATNEPTDLLRMALHDTDDAVFARAALALAKVGTKDQRAVLEDALARVGDPTASAALVARLAELGRDDPAAARIAAHHAPRQPLPVPLPWSGPWRAPAFTPGDRASIEAELDRGEARMRTAPDDEAARLQLAIAQAAFAGVLIAEGGRNIGLWFTDSYGNAERLRSPALQHEAQALIAYTAYMLGSDAAAARARQQAQSAGTGAREPDAWLAARLLELELLAAVQAAQAGGADLAQRVFGAELDRTIALLDLLDQRGAGEVDPMLAGIGLLEQAGLRRDARQRLGRLAAAHPTSQAAHDRWRARLLADVGADAMRREYAQFADAAGRPAIAQWFAGYAALVAAEQGMRDQRHDTALAAYDEAVDRLGRSAAADEAVADSAHHFMVLALAGRAHLRAAAGAAAAAVDDLLLAAKLRPESLDETDGLLRKPRAIAGRIARDLAANGQADLAAKLQAIAP